MSVISEEHHSELAEARPRILVIGAGITGLVLSQALKKQNTPFSLFEREPSASVRGGGWGLTIHWALDTLIALLPRHLVDRLPEAYVDPEASRKGENGNFLFFDLRSGEARWKVPPNKRIRVSRERLRALLLEGLDIQVSPLMSVTWFELLIDHSGLKLLPLSPQVMQNPQSLPTSPTPHPQPALSS